MLRILTIVQRQSLENKSQKHSQLFEGIKKELNEL